MGGYVKTFKVKDEDNYKTTNWYLSENMIKSS